MTGGLLDAYDLKEKANADSLVSFMGIIRAEEEIKMNIMIVRCSHGRAIATFFDFVYPREISFDFIKNEKEEKKIFIVIFPAQAKEYLLKKMLQICDILSSIHYIPPENETKEEIMRDLDRIVKDKKQYIKESESSIKKFIKQFSGTEDKPARMDIQKKKKLYIQI